MPKADWYPDKGSVVTHEAPAVVKDILTEPGIYPGMSKMPK
jgi:hypothetical protein